MTRGTFEGNLAHRTERIQSGAASRLDRRTSKPIPKEKPVSRGGDNKIRVYVAPEGQEPIDRRDHSKTDIKDSSSSGRQGASHRRGSGRGEGGGGNKRDMTWNYRGDK